jgi:uncharacterized membrane protein
MNPQADKLVEAYLKRLNSELRDLPRARRRELVDEITEHISEARSDLEVEDEAAIRTLLDRIGAPEDIAADARERFGIERRGGALDVVAVILLLVGGVILPVIGWVVGVVLLWSSTVWTSREKLVGTLVVPGGLALPLFLMMFGTSDGGVCVEDSTGTVTCTGGTSTAQQVLMITVVALLLVAPIATAIFLARRRTRALASA